MPRSNGRDLKPSHNITSPLRRVLSPARSRRPKGPRARTPHRIFPNHPLGLALCPMEPLGDWLFLAPMTTVALTGTLSVGPTQPIRSLGLMPFWVLGFSQLRCPPRHMDAPPSIGLGRGAVDGPTSRPYLVTISPITLFGDGYPAPKPFVTHPQRTPERVTPRGAPRTCPGG